MAECILQRHGRGRFQSFSAGSQPKGQVNPDAVKLLKKLNYPTENLRSKSWDEFADLESETMDFVFTVCDNAAGETCPIWPGQPMTAHWGVPDPATGVGSDAERGSLFAEIFRMLERRIEIFVNLPLASLDKLTLQKRLNDIGSAK